MDRVTCRTAIIQCHRFGLLSLYSPTRAYLISYLFFTFLAPCSSQQLAVAAFAAIFLSVFVVQLILILISQGTRGSRHPETMPVEHETPPRDTEPSPIRIIADALQRASHIHTLCPPDEVRPNPNERLPPALASEGDLEITDRPEDVIVESLRITDRPLSIGSLISDRPRQISVDVLQDESPGPDFSAAEEGGRVTPAHASRSPVSVTPNPKAQQAKASEISTAPVYQPVDLSEYKVGGARVYGRHRGC